MLGSPDLILLQLAQVFSLPEQPLSLPPGLEGTVVRSQEEYRGRQYLYLETMSLDWSSCSEVAIRLRGLVVTKDMYLQIPPPEPVNFRGNIEENWRYFKSHWRNFSIATGLDNKEDKLKVATLLSIIGKEAYNIFEHLDLSDEQRNNTDEIINALTQHFTPKINIIYERSIFNQTNQ
ncbi:K02A2.6-like [Cordylochernes scorpioides]|uniref:K02A2.6-like n=1 Tax=Cordylochernes scorpioides TaxID=51811 RepID=A0ABY6L424_9ARAC|nr:K02A2.6-like [Cordylochernes scorpioides]